VSGEVVWWPDSAAAAPGRVVVVCASYNTKELIGLLLWSLRRIVRWPDLDVVVVDNGSRDGSAEMLAEAGRAGACTLLANDTNRHHAPALNQGISWLATQPEPLPAWIWALDSDVVAARPGVLADAVAIAESQSAALVGEPQWDPWHQVERFGSYSLLLDPARVWRPGLAPFADDGDPAFGVQMSAAKAGLGLADFPFTADGYVIHRGRSSLAAVYAAGDRSHRDFDWAADHHEPHFAEVPGAAERHQELLRAFRDQTGPLTGASLAAACRSTG
jgi:glycosyltransferase involved in cell wall biosynthesis